MIIFCGLITMATSDPAPAIDESRVVLGDLPDDFLRIMVEVPVPATEGVPPSLLSNGPTQGMLQVTIIEARLAKNYGMMKMDPFVRIITGNFCKRTAICQKGSISPRWNQTVEVPVLPHFQTVTIEVVDFVSDPQKLSETTSVMPSCSGHGGGNCSAQLILEACG
eukprot:TRINITY_DN11742_c0_g2_i13.p2 TRINITY_DN11742_c0_g2~~TRINITY_DN11742_c0_g2_i13.p2  ORF type:complete len:165 (+),score=17.14 TRINITY_DN11742_c0_g2_i13:1543-2037(+)